MSKFGDIQMQVEEDIKNFYNKANIEPIFDGILDVEGYSKSKLKIMWILKEPYDDFDEHGNPVGGGWKFSDLLIKDPSEFIRPQPTWNMIAFSSYAILNNMSFKEIDADVSWDDLQEVLRSIAVINISKLPGLPTSIDGHIFDFLVQNRDLIFKQIVGYEPDIVIGGNTLMHFEKLGYFEGFNFDIDHTQNFYNDKQFFIDAYHPSRRGGWTKEDYVDRINMVVQNWIKKYRK